MYIRNSFLLLCLNFTITGCENNHSSNLVTMPSQQPCNNSEFQSIISCYTQSLSQQVLDFKKVNIQQLDQNIQLINYQLNSQHWSPADKVCPKQWDHEVTIFIPEHPLKKNALLVINDGTNLDQADKNKQPTNFTINTLKNIAKQSNTIVIAVSNIPNQPLFYEDDQKSLKEDFSVARSWDIFMKNPNQFKNMSIHIPMTAAVSQSIRLANQELKTYDIHKYIVTGASKRGWVSWLTAISNENVVAIVPMVFDLLNIPLGLEHMYRSYGKNWPIAFYPYYEYKIDQKVFTTNFAKLMQIEDPIQYEYSKLSNHLNIPKYIINASGDDFYVPDNTRFYYDQLKNKKSLRVVPNSDHGGILNVAESSLISFINRFQNQKAFPQITEKVALNHSLNLSFSEQPIKLTLWTAKNPKDRDFRYACDIRYEAHPLTIPTNNQITISLQSPLAGWQANFIEATFKDGYIATSQVYISPDEIYPSYAPETKSSACQSLSGRGLS